MTKKEFLAEDKMKIFKTKDGLMTQEALYWAFIKSTEQDKEYAIFHSAIVDEEVEVN